MLLNCLTDMQVSYTSPVNMRKVPNVETPQSSKREGNGFRQPNFDNDNFDTESEDTVVYPTPSAHTPSPLTTSAVRGLSGAERVNTPESVLQYISALEQEIRYLRNERK